MCLKRNERQAQDNSWKHNVKVGKMQSKGVDMSRGFIASYFTLFLLDRDQGAKDSEKLEWMEENGYEG